MDGKPGIARKAAMRSPRLSPNRSDRWKSVLGAAALLAVTAWPAQALDTDYPSDGENPLRMVYYFVAPIGQALEWTVARPLAVVGNAIAPYERINDKGFRGCSRERPARSCTNVIAR
jgi:hypothetical protein